MVIEEKEKEKAVRTAEYFSVLTIVVFSEKRKYFSFKKMYVQIFCLNQWNEV